MTRSSAAATSCHCHSHPNGSSQVSYLRVRQQFRPCTLRQYALLIVVGESLGFIGEVKMTRLPDHRDVAFLGVLLLSCWSANAQELREITEYSVQEFLGTKSFLGASFSSDNENLLVSSDASGIFNVYAVPLDGGEAAALTDSEQASIFAESYFPNDERILYSSDGEGDELSHLYVREMDGSEIDLTPGSDLTAEFYGWMPGGQSFLAGTTERDERFYDIYEYQTDGYEREMIFENNSAYEFAGISSDGRFIAFLKVETNADSDIYLYGLENKDLAYVSPHVGNVNHFPATFSPDADSLYYLTDKDAEFDYLMKYEIVTGKRELIEKFDWDIHFASFSERGKYMVVGINNNARTQLRIYETATGKTVEIPYLENAEISSVVFSTDEKLMAFYASSSRNPRDLFVYDFSDGKLRQLTRSLNAKIDPRHLVDGNVVWFESFDQVQVPGILYMPHQASRETKVPALVWVHGGPGGYSGVGYDPLFQYLANHGYAIYAINNRGSWGYGKTFHHLDDRKHGEDDLEDCVWSKTMLVETGYVDPERIGIMGHSYGGYMVLAALAFRPDAFQVGVDLFGISDWYRTLQSIPPWMEKIRSYGEMEMGDFDDEEFFRAKSPLFHADNIVKPLMVLQGANDPRVLKVESDEIVEAVRGNDVPVTYTVFDDEGHGFVKKENRERGYEAILHFLDVHLRDSNHEKSES